jgi:hypothetical protein
MKHRVVALAFVLVVSLGQPSVSLAQSFPDFSGTWTMDLSRSQAAVQNEPSGPVTIVIAQSRNELRLETTRGDKTTAVVYTLDGVENKIPTGIAKTHWDGEALVTETVRDVNGATVTTKETRTLASGGAEMLVETTLVVQHGYSLKGTPNYGAGKDVYTRAARD